MRSTFLLASIVVGLALAGCSDKTAANAKVQGSMKTEDRIEQIRNTPGMPDEQKAQAIAALQSHTGGIPKPP